METLSHINASWWSLLWLTGALVAIFLGLNFLTRLFDALTFSPWLRGPGREILRKLLVLFEPVSAFLIGFMFVFINPIEHGIMVVLLITALFPHLREYLTGRLLILENNLEKDDEIITGAIEGKVMFLGRMGLKILGERGPIHVSYRKLLEVGYEKISGYETGEYVRFLMDSQAEGNLQAQNRLIVHTLSASPFVDWNTHPEVSLHTETPPVWEARVLLRCESHFEDLAELLREKGFNSNRL